PSGDPPPSPEDVRTTEQLRKAGEVLDIEMLDHIVIGHHRFVSLKERRLGF
ncbi:MAG TPA: JAB domain-containing protein, partial [Ktedonobacterales bacterium]|nr:JAB domain-containing protein [Ktedonobacterales bacterium]